MDERLRAHWSGHLKIPSHTLRSSQYTAFLNPLSMQITISVTGVVEASSKDSLTRTILIPIARKKASTFRALVSHTSERLHDAPPSELKGDYKPGQITIDAL